MRSSLKGIAPEWYTLGIDEGEDDPVRFYLKPLDGMAWTTVLMGSYDPSTGAVDTAGIVKAFKLGVKDWENIEDADKPGKPLKFSALAMGKLQPGWIMEVGAHVMKISRIGESDSKNSD